MSETQRNKGIICSSIKLPFSHKKNPTATFGKKQPCLKWLLNHNTIEYIIFFHNWTLKKNYNSLNCKKGFHNKTNLNQLFKKCNGKKKSAKFFALLS